MAGHDASRKETAGLTPTKVSVSVGVPESYYREVIAHRTSLLPSAATAATPPAEPTPQQLADLKMETESNIRAAVEGIAMGIRDGDDRKPYVKVYTFPDLPVAEIPGPSLTTTTMNWLNESWTTLALIAMVLLSLGMMFSWIRSQPGDAETDRKFTEGFGVEVPEDMGDELELSQTDVDATTGERARPEFAVTGGEMKEDLSSLIKDNPDAVVNLLKSWIEDAA